MILSGVILDQVDTTPQFDLGEVFWDVGNKVYKYVQYIGGAGNVAAVVGNVAYYDAESGTVVTSDLSDSGNIGAGVLQAVIPNNGYGWVQIKGVATITPALTAGADGNALTPVGATDGTLDVSALVSDAICAYAIDASAKIIMCDFPF